MRGAVSVLVIVCSLVLPQIARADAIKITSHAFDRAGWPRLLANYTPDGSRGTASWKVCNPDCGAVVTTGAVYNAGPTAIGTTFEASATVDGVTTTDRSLPWLGQVTNTAPPVFAGEPLVGQTLIPDGGAWAGGWGDELRLVGMRACPSAAARDCRAMTASIIQPGNPRQVTVDAAYIGWYVGSLESLVGSGVAFTAIGFGFPPGRVSPLPAPAPSQTVAASALSGPVVGAPGSGPTTRLRFTPRATIRRRAVLRDGTLYLAVVRCSGRCVARATLRHGPQAVTSRIVVTGGQAAVKLRRGVFPRRATSVRVSVRFDNHPARASGRVKLR